jgi:tetratricopeptide (TPR) repeat protein
MRNLFRALPVVLLLGLAIMLPLVLSGYNELKQVPQATTYTEAASHYLAAAHRIPWRADLYELAGHEYYYAKDYSRANEAYQKAFQHHVLSTDGWVAWGDINYLDNNPERAAQIWQQGLELPNTSDKLYSRLAQIYQEQKDYSKAAEYLQRYVPNHLDDASAHYRLGLLLTLSDPKTALAELITASQINPELDPAVQTLRSALNLASVNDSPSERLVIIGRGLGLVQEWNLALAAFQQATQLDKNNAEAWAWLAEANQQTASDDRVEQSRTDAKANLDRALSVNPNSSIVHTLRGLYFQRVGNNRDALAEFQAAAQLQPQDPALYISIGESYSKLGDLIRALQSYQYATTLAPEDANYWRMLAQFCAQNNINIKDVGIPAAQRAVGLKQNDASLEDLLGWLWLMNASYPDAERHLLRAVQLDPQNASAHFHLGMVYLQTDQRDLAREQFILARDLGNAEADNVLKQYFP